MGWSVVVCSGKEEDDDSVGGRVSMFGCGFELDGPGLGCCWAMGLWFCWVGETGMGWAVGEGFWACEEAVELVRSACVVALLFLSVVSSAVIPDEESCSGVPDDGQGESTNGILIGIEVWG